MDTVNSIATILKQEGVEILFCYPVNNLIEVAAEHDIRPVVCRQERIGLHMADAYSRVNSGKKIGVFAMQHGPGAENAFGGVAQAWGESVPILVLPAGYGRDLINVPPNYSSYMNLQHVTKWSEQVLVAPQVPEILRRAWTQVRNGRPRPVLVEIPKDLEKEEVGDFTYTPVPVVRSAPDPADVKAAAKLLVAAENPVLYGGQGIHYSQAWEEFQQLAELVEAPVTTSLGGKSAIAETHPLALGSGGVAYTEQLHHFFNAADLICGIGCSFATTNFGISVPKGKKIIHATLDPEDLNKNVQITQGLIGDAKLVLQALLSEVRALVGSSGRGRLEGVTAEIARRKKEWLAVWMPKLTSSESPLSPYRVIWDLMHTVDKKNTIITHDAGSPRDQLSPFWEAETPLSYLGWGKTTQLGYGLGLAMGAKLARPEKLCINVWGDAAIGFTGMDFETAVREKIPILSIQLNNYSMAMELPIMKVSTEKYRATDISGNYADMAKAFGGYGERVTAPDQIVPAIKRGIAQTEKGVPALLEFMTAKEITYSRFTTRH